MSAIRVPHRHVLPWEAMTPRQRAEHLVYGHGYDADYYDQQGLTDAEVVERFMVETPPRLPDENYPWPSTGAWLHQCDHDEGTVHEWTALTHEHDKTP